MKLSVSRTEKILPTLVNLILRECELDDVEKDRIFQSLNGGLRLAKPFFEGVMASMQAKNLLQIYTDEPAGARIRVSLDNMKALEAQVEFNSISEQEAAAELGVSVAEVLSFFSYRGIDFNAVTVESDATTISGEPLTVPASDRIVHLDHNSAAHKEAVSALEQVEDELVKSNSLDLKPEEREAFVAEVRSAKQLISGKQVRQAAIYFLVQATGILSELWTRFKVETIGALAMAAVAALKFLVGL